MHSRRLTIAATLLGVSVVSFGLVYLLLQDMRMAIVGFGVVIGGGILLVQPFVGLILYILLLYMRPQEYIVALSGMPIMLMVGAATAALTIIHMAVFDKHIRIVHAPQNRLMLWFFAAIVMSHVAWAYLPGVTNSINEFLPIAVMYFIIVNLVSSHARLRVVLGIIAALTVFLAVQGIIQYYTGVAFGGQETYKGRIQGIGIFSDPNDLALALLIVLPYFFVKMTESRSAFIRLVSFVAFATLSFAIYLTVSRGGLITYAVLSMLLFMRRYGYAPGVVIGVVIMAGLVALAPRMDTISTDEGSAYGRIEAWAVGFEMLQSYPLFGVGMGHFTEYHFRTAHNSFVLCAAELGLFGLYPWIMLFFISIKNNQHIVRRIGGDRMGDVAVQVETVRFALIGFAVAAYFLSRTYNELLFILVALSAAISNIFVRESGSQYRLIERRDFIQGLAVTIGALIVTKLFLFSAW